MTRTSTQNTKLADQIPSPWSKQAHQKLMLCTMCPHTGGACQRGHTMMAQLHKAISIAGDSIELGFEISGYVEMGGCDRRCLLAYHSSRDSTYVFGDVAEGADIEALVAYAKANASALNRGHTPQLPEAIQQRPGMFLAMCHEAALA